MVLVILSTNVDYSVRVKEERREKKSGRYAECEIRRHNCVCVSMRDGARGNRVTTYARAVEIQPRPPPPCLEAQLRLFCIVGCERMTSRGEGGRRTKGIFTADPSCTHAHARTCSSARMRTESSHITAPGKGTELLRKIGKHVCLGPGDSKRQIKHKLTKSLLEKKI